MTSELEAATKAYRRAEKASLEKRQRLYDLMVEASRAGIPQTELIRITGYTRERVRQILRAGGIEGPESGSGG